MKIVIINTSERTGGAAVAAGRLGKALNKPEYRLINFSVKILG